MEQQNLFGKQKDQGYREPEPLTVQEQPAYKLETLGTRALSDAEIVSILIPRKAEIALELSRKLLNENDGIAGLGKLTRFDLLRIGLTPNAVKILLAAIELGYRKNQAELPKKMQISSSHDIFKVMAPKLQDLPYEEFWTLFLNRSNRIIKMHKISQGGVSGTVIDTKLILKEALECLASSMILCHNHPSGNDKPSEADRSITKKIKDAAKMMDITVLDHIIIAENKYYSFADEGLMI